MMCRIYIFIVISLLCCEFSEETLQGPPSESKKKGNSESSSKVVTNSEDEEAALKIVPAPDLSKEKERKKGDFLVFVVIKVVVDASRRLNLFACY